MTKSNYVSQAELLETFKILINEDGSQELWRLWRGLNWQKVELVRNHSAGYCSVCYKNRQLKYHTIIYTLLKGDIPYDRFIDHIDGNKLNNSIDNLRLCTYLTNNCNKEIHRNGKLPGASYKKDHKKWRAAYNLNGKDIFIGYFNTELEAHLAYLAKVRTPTTDPLFNLMVEATEENKEAFERLK